jgi:hypothetical protein
MGAPPGPRIKPRCVTDDEGVYMIFTGRHCEVCSLALTSRNRYGSALLCLEHGREKAQARKRTRTQGNGRLPPVDSTGQVIERCPHRQAVHRALMGWLNHPTEERLTAHLHAAMADYELRSRLLRLIPPQADCSSPL